MLRRLPIWAALLLLCAWCGWLGLKPPRQRASPEDAPVARADPSASEPLESATPPRGQHQSAAASGYTQQESSLPVRTNNYSLHSILTASNTPASLFSNEEVKRREAGMQHSSEALVRGWNRAQTLQQMGPPTHVFGRHEAGPRIGKWKRIEPHYLTLEQALEAKEGTIWLYSPNPRYPTAKHPLYFQNLEVSFDQDGYLTNWVWSMPSMN